jgi:4-hydroxybenzoate polyprenyltransferase
VNKPVAAVIGFTAVTVVGLVLATLGAPLGGVVAVAGLVLVMATLIVIYRIAWRRDQKRAWDPGSLRREYRAEQEARRK